MPIKIDPEKCICCGTCAAMCPNLFLIDLEINKAKVIEKASEDCTCDLESVTKSCPVEAISQN